MAGKLGGMNFCRFIAAYRPTLISSPMLIYNELNR